MDGVAVHWYMDDILGIPDAPALEQTHDEFPDKFILYSEACTGRNLGLLMIRQCRTACMDKVWTNFFWTNFLWKFGCTVQVHVQVHGGLTPGFVDFDLDCSSICPILLERRKIGQRWAWQIDKLEDLSN